MLAHYSKILFLATIIFGIILGLSNCAKDIPAIDDTPIFIPQPTTPTTSTCACSTTVAGCPCTGPETSTTTSPEQPMKVDTLEIAPPHFSPNGGNFYMSTPVELIADSLPQQGIIEYSVDAGITWQANQKFTLTTGGDVLTRIRVGEKISRSRSASFTIYFKRIMIIGNSIMLHPPSPTLGWYNNNGMAASAPEKDFAHLLTTRFKALYPALEISLQLYPGLNFESKFGTADYSIDEFNNPLQEFKPDLIVMRISENIDDSQVASRNLETHYRNLLERLASFNQPVRIVCTTSVWYKPNTDDVIRKVTTEKGHTLVDLNYIVWQKQCFASEYANPGVAMHPNDQGMKLIADMIWEKVQ